MLSFRTGFVKVSSAFRGKPFSILLGGLMLLLLSLTCLAPAQASAAEPTEYTVTGKVLAKGQDNFTLKRPNSTTPATLRVNAQTQYYQGTKPVSFSAMQVGMEISVVIRWQAQGNFYLALRVYLPAAPDQGGCARPYVSSPLSAQVAAKTPNSFTVTWSNNETSKISFLVTSATKFSYKGEPASFASMYVGEQIRFVVQSCGDGKYYVREVNLL